MVGIKSFIFYKNMEESNMEKWDFKSMFRLENLPVFFTTLLVFLAPIFFIPSQYFSLQSSKAILVFSLVVVAFFVFLVSILKKGRFDIPVGKMYICAVSVPTVMLISALLSKVPAMSILGFGYENNTFAFILVMFMFMFLVLSLFRSEKNIFYSYLAIFASFVLISLFHLIRLIFGPDSLSFGFFNLPTHTFLGSWYDLSIFYGMTLVLSLVSIEMFKTSKLLKLILRLIFFVSICFLVIINFSLIWIVLAVLSLVFFVYLFSFEQVSSGGEKQVGEDGETIYISKREGNVRRISILTMVVLILSCLFLTPLVSNIGNSISSTFNLSNIEARPSWSATIEVSKSVLKDDAFFGSGLNTFSSQWQLQKPAVINVTPFWDAEFNVGVGFIPTFLANAGVLGLLSWIAFLAFFLYAGFISLFTKGESGFMKYLTASSFFVALYLWIMLVVYIPSTSIIVLTFFFTGLFFATLHRENILRSFSVSFSSYPRASFAMVLSLVVVMIATLSLGYFFAERTLSAYYFSKGVVAVSQNNDIDSGEMYTLKAASLWGSDLYYRGLSELQIIRLANVVSSVTSDEVSDEVRNEFQRVLGAAIDNANRAVIFDETNYQNWVSLARVYDVVNPLGVEQAYEIATKAYNEAIKNSPQNPRLYLMLARLEASKSDFEKAKEYISIALSKKPNYTEAIFFRSQIEVAEGNIKGAISSMEGIALISPNNASVFFELGLLNYNNKDYARAATALEKATSLVNDYSNARYFLGLSYEKLGKKADAIAQFEMIAKLNPDNEEVALILENLKAGRAAFADAEPPVDDEPEKREKLPVEEDGI